MPRDENINIIRPSSLSISLSFFLFSLPFSFLPLSLLLSNFKPYFPKYFEGVSAILKFINFCRDLGDKAMADKLMYISNVDTYTKLEAHMKETSTDASFLHSTPFGARILHP